MAHDWSLARVYNAFHTFGFDLMLRLLLSPYPYFGSSVDLLPSRRIDLMAISIVVRVHFKFHGFFLYRHFCHCGRCCAVVNV